MPPAFFEETLLVHTFSKSVLLLLPSDQISKIVSVVVL
jgi:hypothetical protein